MRKFLIAAAILIALVVGAVMIGPNFVNWNAYKTDIAAQLTAATGRDIAIDGELSLAMLPSPRLLATGVRLTAPDGSEFEELLRLRELEVHVALAPLIEQRLQISSIVLVEPEIMLQRLADGRVNWVEALARASDGGGNPAALAVQFENVRLQNGTVIYRDAVSGVTERLENLDATFAADSLRGPMRGGGTATLRDTPIEFEMGMGEWVADRGVPINAALGLREGTGKLDIAGVVTGWPSAPRITGTVSITSDDLYSSLVAIAPSAPSPYLAQQFSLQGTLSGSAEAVALSEILVQFGETMADGRINISLGPVRHAEATLSIGRVDLDAIIAAGRAQTIPAEPAATAGSFALPGEMTATFDARVDAVLVNDGIVRQVQLAGDLRDGKLTLSQINALLPGGSNVTLFGEVTTAEGQPQFAGQVEAHSDNFRGLLEWIDVDVTDVPLGRLRKLEAQAQVKATPTGVTVSEIDIIADVSRFRGGIAVALRKRPGFGIGISVDKLDIGAYLPATNTVPDDPAAATIGLRERLQSFTLFDSFDAILQLEAGALTYKDIALRGMQFDGTLQGGSLELRAARIADLAGSEITFAGAISDVTGEPQIGLDINIEARDGAALLALAGVELELALDNTSLAARLDGGFETMQVDATLRAMDGEFSARGNLRGLDRDLGFDLELSARHGEAVALANLLGANLAGELGALDLTATLVGDVAAALSDLTVTVGDGTLTARTQWSQDAAGPSVELDLVASYPDFGRMLRAAAPAYRPALAAPEPFRLESQVHYDSERITANGLQSELGPVHIEGDASLALAGPRPRLDARLTTSEIIVDRFLHQPDATTQPAADNRSQHEWSRYPIDWSVLSVADAQISLRAPALTYGPYRIDEPEFKLSLDSGVLRLDELTGRAFDGDITVTARVEAADLPAARLKLEIDGADAPKLTEAAQAGATEPGNLFGGLLRLLFPVDDIRVASGRMSANLEAAGAGRNELELVSSLDGDARLELVDAVIEGADLCAINAQLGQPDGVEAFLALLDETTAGGQTKIDDFAGSFTIVGGVATLPRQTLAAECATTELWGTVDLPRWTQNMWAHAMLPEHPDFPGIRVNQAGDIDTANTAITNLAAVRQYIAARVAPSVIQQVAPELPQVAPQIEPVVPEIAPIPPTPDQPPAEAAPQDRFRDVLDNLIRR